MAPHKPRAKNAFDWFFNHEDIITLTDYFIHNEGKSITIEDIDKAYGFSDFYQKNNLLKHMRACNIIRKTAKGYKLNKTTPATKALIKLKTDLQKHMGDR